MIRDESLARLATAGTIACVLLVAGTVAFSIAHRAYGAPRAVGYAVGQPVDVPAEAFARADRTVIIFARSSCASCQQMKPARARLTAALATSPSVAVAILAPDADPDGERQFARDIGRADALWLVEINRLRVTVVPTVLVVDREGIVRFVRTGTGWAPADDSEFRRAVGQSGKLE